MNEQSEQPGKAAATGPRRLRWILGGLIALLYISLVVSGHGVLFWIQNTTRPSDEGLSHGSIPTVRCRYFTGTETFASTPAMGFGAEPCRLLRRAPASPPVSAVDAAAVLPDGALNRERYVRRYSRREVRIGDDTPYFTTQGDFGFIAPRRVWVAVYTLSGDLDEKQQPGVIQVSEDEAMPMVFHGGCAVVNLVADVDDGETLASWCNVDDGPMEDGAPRAAPTFIRR